MSENAKLLPCPFCKHEDVRALQRCGYHFLFCTGCDAQGPMVLNADEAIAAWNRRGPVGKEDK